MNYLYKNVSVDELQGLHGNGFSYTGRLEDDYTFSDDEIVEKIRDKFFDMIVYGKVGPDEGPEGSYPNFPLWNYVHERYNRDEIICLYGGDECTDNTCDNIYSEHIYFISQFATCFVRELK